MIDWRRWFSIAAMILFTSINGHSKDFNAQILPVIVEIITTVWRNPPSNHVVLHNFDQDLQKIHQLRELIKIMGHKEILAVSLHIDKMNIHLVEGNEIFVLVSVRKEVQQLFKNLSETHYSKPTKWLFFVSDEGILDDLSTPINSHCIVLRRKNNSIVLTEKNNIHPQLPLQQREIRLALLKNSFLTSWLNVGFFKKRDCLQNSTIKIVTALKRNNVNGKLSGFYGEVWSVLQEKLKFKENFLEPRDGGSYGSQSMNGTWSGMMGMLVRNEADIAIGGFALTPERLEAIDFLPPMVEGSVTVYIRQPDLDTFSMAWLLAPFNTNLWLVLLIIILCLSLELQATWKYGQQEFKNWIHSSWLHIFGSFCQQGQPKTSQPASSTVLCVTAYLTAMVILSVYSATFTSFLAVQHVQMPFSSLEGLLEDGTYQLGMLTRSATLNYFDKSNNSLMNEIYNKLIAPEKYSLPVTNEQGLTLICKRKKYAYMSPSITAEMEISKLPCRIIEVPNTDIPVSSSMVVNKHNPYRKLMDSYVQHMRRVGILSRIHKNIWPTQSTGILENPSVYMAFASMAPLLSFLTIGIIVSIIILFIEYLRYKHVA
ncbi:Ionotropic receptor 145 [Blattella germanica]|nr:Ionotropic receptor 145 [Blattella germanica]